MLLPLSLGIYLAALIVPITVPTWPVPGQWFFNPFAWQVLFVLGFALSRPDGIGDFVQRHIDVIRLVALPVAVLGAVVALFSLFPDPTIFPEPKLLFLNGKTFLTPVRLLQFLALAAVVSVTYPYIVRAVPWLVTFLSVLGRNSLNVFCVASVLSLGWTDCTLPLLGLLCSRYRVCSCRHCHALVDSLGVRMEAATSKRLTTAAGVALLVSAALSFAASARPPAGQVSPRPGRHRLSPARQGMRRRQHQHHGAAQ